jgi:hypothetical protein
MRSISTVLAGALALGVATACAVDEDQEKAIGQEAAAEVERQAPIIRNPANT